MADDQEEQKAERYRLFLSSAVRQVNEWREPKEIGAEPVTRTDALSRIKARWKRAELAINATRSGKVVAMGRGKG